MGNAKHKFVGRNPFLVVAEEIADQIEKERQQRKTIRTMICIGIAFALIGGVFEFWIMNPNAFGAKQTNQEEVRR